MAGSQTVKECTMSPKELVIALFTAAFVDHDPEAARQLVTPDYIQHNPQVPTGAEGLVGLIPLDEQSGMTVTTRIRAPHMSLNGTPAERMRGAKRQKLSRPIRRQANCLDLRSPPTRIACWWGLPAWEILILTMTSIQGRSI